MANKSSTEKSHSNRLQEREPVIIPGESTPYAGDWKVKQAAHLLRRTTFGPTKAMIDRAVDQGLEATLDELMSNGKQPMPQPVKWLYDERQRDRRVPFVEDPFVSYGEPWIEAPLEIENNRELNQQIQNYKQNSILANLFLQMHQGEISIREKLLIFWHNHFVVANVRFPELMYRYLHSIHNFDLSELSTDRIVNVVNIFELWFLFHNYTLLLRFILRML
jgi:hypothetical protein